MFLLLTKGLDAKILRGSMRIKSYDQRLSFGEKNIICREFKIYIKIFLEQFDEKVTVVTKIDICDNINYLGENLSL